MAQQSYLIPVALACTVALCGCTAPGNENPLASSKTSPLNEMQKQAIVNTSSPLIGVDAASAINPAPPPGGAPMLPEADVGSPTQVSAGDLKAGSVDDNEAFSNYLKYLRAFDWSTAGMPPRKLDVSERVVIRVEDASERVVPDAEIVVEFMPDPIGAQADGEASAAPVMGRAAPREVLLRTYADGQALLHPLAEAMSSGSFTVRASKNNATGQATVKREDDTWVVKLTDGLEPQRTAIPLDLALVIDTTGSMGGEIAKFQATMESIIQRIKNLPQNPQLRLGLVAYRDKDEAYVTKMNPFTDDAQEFLRALNDLSAAGGGDTPEDMEAALKDCVNGLAWREQDALRLSFLVADAAPHTDYPQSTPYTESLRIAARKGIKFYPIGASGLAPEGEYVMRQLAQWTRGQYMFVTRGGDENSGGGGAASANVEQFSEGRLDDIVVERVTRELKKYAGE
ncbi:MAG: vWA domain-containing protein [Candidatus Sericytochromatia bacterium]|nr:vWA domain-containing protein [Candidatus Sericytochromatia bacterium]